MRINNCQQRSQEWYNERKGKISGTRFSQVISGKKNRLIYELLNEDLNECLFPDDFINDEMQFGIDNEPIARAKYNELMGFNFKEIGLIYSDFSSIHCASPDGKYDNKILEIKCTENGSIHLQRFFEGVESNYKPQIINYFAVSDDVEEVHWISYCPYRIERPLISIIFKRSDFEKEIIIGRAKIKEIESQLIDLKNRFIF